MYIFLDKVYMQNTSGGKKYPKDRDRYVQITLELIVLRNTVY
jgi:hypothetical protein